MSEAFDPRNNPVPNTGPLLVATSLALATLAPVAAHQLGKLKRLPDPPGRLFRSDRITGSSTAHPFGVPDSLLGIASYSVTLTLALLARRHWQARKLLGIKLLGDGTMASINMIRQIVTFRRLCSWCTGTVVCTAAMLIAGRGLIRAELSDTAWRGLNEKAIDLATERSSLSDRVLQ